MFCVVCVPQTNKMHKLVPRKELRKQAMNNKMLILPENQNKVNKKQYGSLDGLRAYAALGIVLMHVQANMKKLEK